MRSVKYILIIVFFTGLFVVCSCESQSATASDKETNIAEPNTTISELGIEVDTFKTNGGDLKITFVGHGTLMFEFADKVIHVDPVGREADYTKMPKADLILITHEHGDHLDPKAIDTIKKDGTEMILTQVCSEQVSDGQVMKNGDTKTVMGLMIEAVPAYNLEKNFHPKGRGNGYVITFADKKVYVAGDTENIPEMKNLKNIDIAFLPMNLPYTMSPEMAADAAKVIKPKILYPYHYSQTDTSIIVELLKDSETDVRIRQMQ